MENLENNYLSKDEWKSFEKIMMDVEIKSDLSFKHDLTIEEISSFTDNQISDLINFWDPYYSEFEERALHRELDKIIEEKNKEKNYFDELDEKKEELSEKFLNIWKLINFLTDLDYEKNWSYEDFWNSDWEINENLEKFLADEKNKFSFFDLKIDKTKENIYEKISIKIPDRISRFAFDREWFTWVRYYIFKDETWLQKVCVWFYWWSTWRWNDWVFKNFYEKNKELKNVEKIDLKLSEIVSYLKIKNQKSSKK